MTPKRVDLYLLAERMHVFKPLIMRVPTIA